MHAITHVGLNIRIHTGLIHRYGCLYEYIVSVISIILVSVIVIVKVVVILTVLVPVMYMLVV